jgi:hypothetical protein
MRPTTKAAVAIPHSGAAGLVMARVRAKPWLPARKVLAVRVVTAEQIALLAAQGLRTQEIALRLRCNRVTVWRIAKAARIVLVRPARVRGLEQWLAAFEQHGPTVRGVARGVGMDPTYVHRQLQALGILPTPGEDIDEDHAA